MGIRYFGISIDQEDYDRISAGPCPSCGARPHRRSDDAEWGEPDNPDTLDLDKSWGYLQRILESELPRPAYALVAGGVTNTSRGWISHQGVVAPSEVPHIAADLESVTAAELRGHFERDGEWADERAEGDWRYVSEHLASAITFAKKVASDGRGIVYYIG